MFFYKGDNVMKTIRGKLFLVVGIVFIVSVLGMLVNIHNVNNVRSSSNSLANTTFLMYQDATQIQISIEEMQAYMYAYCTAETDENKESIKTLYTSASQALFTALDDFAELGGINDFEPGSEEAENWEILTTAIEAYDAYFDEISALVDDGNADFAKELVWSDVKDNQIVLLQNMEGMRTQNAGEISDALSSQVKLANTTSRISLITIILLLIAAVIAGVVTSFLIVQPIRHADRKLKSIISDIESGHGNLTERIPVETKDEIGQLVSGLALCSRS